MATTYNAAPVQRFRPASGSELDEMSEYIADSQRDKSATTDWHRESLYADREALATVKAKGKPIWFAQDEDGYYFATEDAEAAAFRTTERMRESSVAFAVQNIREGIQTANAEQESHYREVYQRLTGEAHRDENETFYRRIAEIQAASPDAVEITARCSGGGTTWTEDHHFATIADAVQFAWSDEPQQRGIVTIDGRDWHV